MPQALKPSSPSSPLQLPPEILLVLRSRRRPVSFVLNRLDISEHVFQNPLLLDHQRADAGKCQIQQAIELLSGKAALLAS